MTGVSDRVKLTRESSYNDHSLQITEHPTIDAEGQSDCLNTDNAFGIIMLR